MNSVRFCFQAVLSSLTFAAFFGLIFYAKNDDPKLIVQKVIVVAILNLIHLLASAALVKNLRRNHWLILAVPYSTILALFWLSLNKLFSWPSDVPLFQLNRVDYFAFVVVFLIGFLNTRDRRNKKNDTVVETDLKSISVLFSEFKKNFRI